jgi:serine/threonine-protein kinase
VSVTFALDMPKVPNVVGSEIEAATGALEAAGYTVLVGEPIESADHPEGAVAEQVPAADTPLQKSGKVTLRPSSGGEIEVPKLVGLSVKNATTEAEKAKLKLAIQWVSLAETASYVALRQIPQPGTKVKPESEVKIVVNRD